MSNNFPQGLTTGVGAATDAQGKTIPFGSTSSMARAFLPNKGVLSSTPNASSSGPQPFIVSGPALLPSAPIANSTPVMACASNHALGPALPIIAAAAKAKPDMSPPPLPSLPLLFAYTVESDFLVLPPSHRKSYRARRLEPCIHMPQPGLREHSPFKLCMHTIRVMLHPLQHLMKRTMPPLQSMAMSKALQNTSESCIIAVLESVAWP